MKASHSVCASLHPAVFLQVSLRPARCYGGALSSRRHSFISPFLTQASPLFTPSLLLQGSVSTNLKHLPSRLCCENQLTRHSDLNLFYFFITAYVVLAGRNGSSLYSWRSDVNLFTMILRAPPAISFMSLTAPSLNTTKTLLASAEENSSTVYEFTFVSNQSDFIPRYLHCFYKSEANP